MDSLRDSELADAAKACAEALASLAEIGANWRSARLIAVRIPVEPVGHVDMHSPRGGGENAHPELGEYLDAEEVRNEKGKGADR